MPGPTSIMTIRPALLFSCLLLCAPAHAAKPESTVGYDCIVMPHAVVEVSSGVSGRLERINVERGDKVTQGQLLAALESGVERANVALARTRAALDTEVQLRQARLSFDERRSQRVDALFQKSATSTHEKDEADNEAELAALRVRQAHDNQVLAQLELSRAEELLKLRTVYSPIDGVVVERFKWPGEFVEEEPIVGIAQLDPLRVEAIVPVERHGLLSDGQHALVYPETAPDTPRAATITVIDPMGDPASGTFRVRLELPNPGNELLGGIKCKLGFQNAGPAGAPAPRTAEVMPPPLGDTPSHTPVSAELAGRFDPDPSRPAPTRVAARTLPQAAMECRTAGPLDDRRQVDGITEALARLSIESTVRETTTAKPNGYVVLAAPGDSDADVWGLADRLRASGVHDLLVMGRGDYAGHVALGTYAGPLTAERRRARLADLGFDVEVRARSRSRPAWWVDVRVPAQGVAHDAERVVDAFGIGLTECPAFLTASNTSD